MRNFSMMKAIVAVAVVLAALSSCSREIVLDPQEEPLVAVECVLTDSPVQNLKMMMTKVPSMNAASVIDEADVLLIDITANSEVGRFERRDSVTWTLDYTPEYKHGYRLEVRVPGRDLVWAEQTMLEECMISTIRAKVLKYYRPFEHWLFPGVDKPSDRWAIQLEGLYISMYPHSAATWIRALNYNHETGEREIAEQICSDYYAYADKFNLSGVYEPPTSSVLLGYYDHTGGLENMENWPYEKRYFLTSLYGGMDGYPLHKRYLRFETGLWDKNLAGKQILISGSFTGRFYNGDPVSMANLDSAVAENEGIIVVSVVSEDYDKFLLSGIKAQQISESDDLSSIYLRENSYSNINGGVGIFGAKTEKVLGWIPAYTIVTDSSEYPIEVFY